MGHLGSVQKMGLWLTFLYLFFGTFLQVSAHSPIAGRASTVPPLPFNEQVFLKRDGHIGYFEYDQVIDHKDWSFGTFKQRAWYNTEFWDGPGSPIILFTPGENDASYYGGYLGNGTVVGRLAQEMKGAVVMVEHRYYGRSSPYTDLTVKNLQYLTVNNSISDYLRFAQFAKLPFDQTGSNPRDAPWVFVGASYAAALVTWTESVAPGTFAAYYASSGPVQAVEDFWQYYSPIVKGMPRNCSEDLFEFIAYMDRVFKIGSPKAQTALKDEFGLGSLRNDDFSATIAYGLWLWQANTFAASSGFADFCDSIEGLYNDPVLKLPPRLGRSSVPSGTLVRTFNGYSKWVRTVLLPNFCSFYRYPAGSLECLDTYSPDNFIYKDAELVDNRADRQWEWMLCNEPLGFRFGGAPQGMNAVVSRTLTPEYWTRQCDLFFPAEGEYTHGLNLGRDESAFNEYTRAWFPLETENIIHINGEYDPWAAASVASDFRPGGPLQSTADTPSLVIKGGYHCSDLLTSEYNASPEVKVVVDEAVSIVKKWVEEFYGPFGRNLTQAQSATVRFAKPRKG